MRRVYHLQSKVPSADVSPRGCRTRRLREYYRRRRYASYATPLDTIACLRRVRRGVKVACDRDPLTPQLGRWRLRWVLVGILADASSASESHIPCWGLHSSDCAASDTNKTKRISQRPKKKRLMNQNRVVKCTELRTYRIHIQPFLHAVYCVHKQLKRPALV
ncbi:jg1700 [Pararge aegeria aegeria]|uniref:Jg1700 protein n=1 Tax=Pararge aegeria aegeria TaxID=348720 RepID=A0A8S4SPQ2_9NEOP|nr:jg1700 [Pararge aegeria aegeria]